MKISKTTAVMTLVLLLTTRVFAQVTDDVSAVFERLSENSATTGQEWFDLAGQAREARVFAIAGKSLEQAGKLEFSPVRLGFERARLLIAKNEPEAAVAELQNLADNGFTTVAFLTGDPIIHSLAGREDYDALTDEMARQAYPCAHKDGFEDFDFWVGKWVVHVANGARAGENVIRKAERGCILIENWTNTAGGTGMSVNFLDLASNEWVQVWNSEGGSQINIRGGLTDDGMRMEGHIHYVANGTTAPFRALWTPLPDGRVRQYFEQSNDDGETWVPWFEGFYTKVD